MLRVAKSFDKPKILIGSTDNQLRLNSDLNIFASQFRIYMSKLVKKDSHEHKMQHGHKGTINARFPNSQQRSQILYMTMIVDFGQPTINNQQLTPYF